MADKDDDKRGQRCPQCGRWMVSKKVRNRDGQPMTVYWCPDCEAEPQS